MKLLLMVCAGLLCLLWFPSCVQEPTACFTNDKGDTIKVNTQVEFYSCSNDTETHHWDFGDGVTVSNAGTAIKHTYTKEGSYSVTLHVRNGTKTDMTSRLMTVLP